MQSRHNKKEPYKHAEPGASPIAELPMLQLQQSTNENNFSDWSRKLRFYVLKNFRTLKDCIYLEELEDIEETPAPNPTEIAEIEADATGLVAHAWKKRVEKALANEDLRKRELQSLFGIILGCLTSSVRQRLISHEEYEDIQTETNGFDLFVLLKQIMTCGDTLEDDSFKQDRVMTRYANIKMKEGEEISEYLERFNESIDAHSAVNLNAPAENLQVIKFINGLDHVKYGEFKRQINNLSRMGVALPATLAEAINRLNGYDGNNRSTHAPQNNSQAVYSAERTSPQCNRCGRYGHTARDCYTRLEPSNRSHHCNQYQNRRHRGNNSGNRPTPQTLFRPNENRANPRRGNNSAVHPNRNQNRNTDRPANNHNNRHNNNRSNNINGSRHNREETNEGSSRNIGFAQFATSADAIDNVLSSIFMAVNNNVNEKDFTVLLDNGAQSSIFRNPHLLSNIRECVPITINGVNGNDAGLEINK